MMKANYNQNKTWNVKCLSFVPQTLFLSSNFVSNVHSDYVSKYMCIQNCINALSDTNSFLVSFPFTQVLQDELPQGNAGHRKVALSPPPNPLPPKKTEKDPPKVKIRLDMKYHQHTWKSAIFCLLSLLSSRSSLYSSVSRRSTGTDSSSYR